MTGVISHPWVISKDGVVSGLSSKVSACSMLIKNSAEARLGGMIEQSLLKQT